ncbi:MAG: alpha/beta hydrolase [Pseudomonadota bacterium]
MIAWLAPLLAAAGCYVAAALAQGLSLTVLGVVLRAVALWWLAAYLGYGVSLALGACLVAAITGCALLTVSRWLLQVLFALLACVCVLAAPQPLYWPLLLGLIVADQTLGLIVERVPPLWEAPNWLLACALVAVVGTGVVASRWVIGIAQPPATERTLQTLPGALVEGDPRLWMRLETNAAGAIWIDRRAAPGGRCALLFHGAHASGSLQSTARSLVRSLRLAGYRTLALDHPGYGASPAPTSDAVAAWDPAVLTAHAVERARQLGCTRLLPVGHSMGVTEALRLGYAAPAQPGIERVLLLGAGLFEDNGSTDAYWHDRFHIDRGLQRRLGLERWREIRDAYYRNEAYCADRRRRQAGVGLDYLTFAHEHANLVASRDRLWRCLEFIDSRRRELPTSHYLDAFTLGPLTILQYGAIGALREHLQTLRPAGG